MLVTNVQAEISTEPDAMFCSYETLQAGLIRLPGGEQSLELEGTPDMTLEVVSKTSVQKDTVVLREQYWQAGVKEYWLVDSRAEQPTLDILRHTPKGYVAARNQSGGWLKSAVFAKSFRLTQHIDQVGIVDYRLEVR